MKKFTENDIKKKMLECIVSCQNNINKYNVNSLNISLISNLSINYYGNKVFLHKLSRITVENFNSIRISLFDKKIKNDVKKCIFLLKLDLNVMEDKNDLIIYLPSLTQERKKKNLKLLKGEIELFKICIRNVRRDFKKKSRLMLKNKIISENENLNINIKLQKITCIYIEKLNDIFLSKKKELIS